MTEQLDQAARSEPAELDISKGWVQGIALVMVFGFFVMGCGQSKHIFQN